MINRYLVITLISVLCFSFVNKTAYAQCDCVEDCGVYVGACAAACGSCERNQLPGTNQHFTDELDNHILWFQEIFWLDRDAGDPVGLLAAIELMVNQLTTNAVLQTQMIGNIFDAKHQLETQRLFQQLTAQAHKDYQPNEKLCEVGTIARPLAASERKSNLASQYISKYNLDRQLLAHDDENINLITENSSAKDKYSRLRDFIVNFCQAADNSRNLNFLCLHTQSSRESRNRDIDYTALIDKPLTLDVDFVDPEITLDERALFALTSHLVAEEIVRNVPADKLVDEQLRPSFGNAAITYLDSRALAAKRSVATNSIAAIAGMKVKGSPESDPFIYAIIDELFEEGTAFEEVLNYIGENPSYYAQMEILTKKIYQHPNFYAELYDKPANVLRKDVAIQAAELMQKRDIYRSLLRSEAVLATMLETKLEEQQSSLTNILAVGEDGWAERLTPR